MLREADAKLSAIAAVDPEKARAEILKYHCKEQDDLSPAANCYYDYLNFLDRTLLLLEAGAGEPRIVKKWLRGVLKSNDALRDFIEKLQRACKDDSVLEYLQRHLLAERRKQLQEKK